jgi:hypothetical protein
MIGTTQQPQTVAPVVTAPTCDTCGETLAPSGGCLNAGGCLEADRRATHSGQHGDGGKWAVPAAWSATGRVD